MLNKSLNLKNFFTTETRRHGDSLCNLLNNKTGYLIRNVNNSGIFSLFSFVPPCLRGYRLKASFLLVLTLFASGCTLAKVDVNVVSERTSLENQVLGTYNSLSQDMLLVASVRGVSPTGKIETPPRHTPEQVDATRAMETIAFHADDVERFKRFGWVGENQEGLLTPFTRETPKVSSEELKLFAAKYSTAEFQQVVAEVNRSRDVLMMRVVQTNENFTLKDLPAIRKVFAKINRENSAPGSRVEDIGGKWITL